MNYSNIRDLAKKHEISDIELEIVSCVNSSSWQLSDEDFELICEYVKSVWHDVDKTYIQLISDIVCDLYQDLEYGFRDEEDERFLTKEDLKYGAKKDMVIDLFYDRYYD